MSDSEDGDVSGREESLREEEDDRYNHESEPPQDDACFERMDVEGFKRHVKEVVELIGVVTGSDWYTVTMTRRSGAEHSATIHELCVNKKAGATSLNVHSVTPIFPVRLQLYSDSTDTSARKMVVRCTGTLCSPLLSEVDQKLYRPCLNVPIGSVASLTDFLCLHLCFGFSVVRGMMCTASALKVVDAEIDKDLQIEPLVDKGFLITYKKSRKVTLKINENMEMEVERESGQAELLPVLRTPPPPRFLITAAGAEGAEEPFDDWNTLHETRRDRDDGYSTEHFEKYIDHCFADRSGRGDAEMPLKEAIADGQKVHDTLMQLMAALFNCLMF